MNPADLNRIFSFLIELDKLKAILRKTKPIGLNRQENSAEHSWQICVAAALLAGAAQPPVDVARVIEMLLLHDIPEIKIGDQLVYQTKTAEFIAAEKKAAQELFAQLPESLSTWAFARWCEFETRESPEAKFAYAIDRMMPVLQNLHMGGQSWVEHKVEFAQILKVNSAIGDAIPTAWKEIEAKLQTLKRGAPLAHW